MAEARRRIVGDCVAVCGCCPCLALQILVLLMIDVPKRLARKSRRFLKRKRRTAVSRIEMEFSPAVAPPEEIFPMATSITDDGGVRYRCAMAEVREVMEEFHERGEFSFGSFWRRRGVEEVAAVPPRNAAVVVEVRWM